MTRVMKIINALGEDISQNKNETLTTSRFWKIKITTRAIRTRIAINRAFIISSFRRVGGQRLDLTNVTEDWTDLGVSVFQF